MDPALNTDHNEVNSNGVTDTKNVTKESKYWIDFYASFDIAVPSQFCVMLATEADKSRPVVEFGCGNGRDSIYLASHGFKVFAGDICTEAIAQNRQKTGCPEKENGADFSVCDVSVPDDVRALINKARGEQQGGNLNLYNRFFLHSLNDEQERLFLTALASATKPGDCLYMEFRCSLDAKLDHLFKGHFRRYVDTSKLVAMLEDELEFNVTYETTGQGMAKYRHEDPFVSRIIAERKKKSV
jgi:SAM-dependent methyltransferase